MSEVLRLEPIILLHNCQAQEHDDEGAPFHVLDRNAIMILVASEPLVATKLSPSQRSVICAHTFPAPAYSQAWARGGLGGMCLRNGIARVPSKSK